ncbi:MAG: hypothetical protein ACOYJK_04155 [Prevotella sp.]
MRHNNFAHILLCGTFIMALGSCADEDLVTPQAEEETQGYTYQMESSVGTADKTGQKGTRSLVEDEASHITSTWQDGDELILFNQSDGDKSTQKQYNYLKTTANGKDGFFNGTITSLNPITVNDKLTFLYPANAFKQEPVAYPVENSKYTVTNESDGSSTTLEGYHQTETIKKTVEIDLMVQDGTAETIGKKFDFQWGAVNPQSVENGKIKAHAGKLQRLVAFWGLRFADQNSKILTDIDKVYISNVVSTNILDLTTGKFVGTEKDDWSYGMELIANPTSKLTSANGKYTYAAMLPGTYYDVSIIVYIGDKMYKRTLPKCTFEANGIYRDDIIQMEVVNEDDGYVEVQGTKWATGNLIHYQEPAGDNYWGIAPTQWWIADYACDNSDQKRPMGSQFRKNYQIRAENQDVFSFGNIENALSTGDHYITATNKDISGRLFKTAFADLTKNETTLKSEAKWGDLAYYHTMDKNHVYRLPNKDEIQKLYDNANVYPGYCTTDKGNRIYGVYFYTCRPGATRIKGMPTGARQLYKYTDVTPLVRAQIGLFLPITGKRNVGGKTIGYRDMSLIQGTYGQYMTGYMPAAGTNRCLFAGTSEWNLGPGYPSQGIAIRPVLDRVEPNNPENTLPESIRNLK